MRIATVAAKKAKADAYIVGVTKDRKAPGLAALGLTGDAVVAQVLGNKTIGLGPKTVRTLPTPKGWVVLAGLGDTKQLTQEKLGALANSACRAAAGVGCKTAATTLVSDSRMNAELATQAIVQGAILGSLDFDQWKSKQAKDAAKADNALGTGAAAGTPRAGKARRAAESRASDATDLTRGKQVESPKESVEGAAEEEKPIVKLEQLGIIIIGGKIAQFNAVRRAADRAVVVAAAVNDARLLANTPANVATPVWLAEQAKERGRQHGFKVAVLGRAELRKQGFGALCGVAQGSVNEEQLVVMDYHPAGAKRTLAVIGKGVCFDSGGISIKPGDKMWEMKYDKCGACNTIALMTTLKALGVKHRVVGVVAAVENLPSGTAQRPGDIVTAKDGTTIEVLNTDAEGRLILADAITHARTFEPDWIIDMATLTGACEIAVGPTYVAVMSNDDRFARTLVQDAARAGDKAWHLPQGEEYDEANKGTYADLQNISLTNRAGTCIGGSFLKHFAKDTTFAHLDIASKAWTGGMDYFAKGPTGAGMRIVLERILDE